MRDFEILERYKVKLTARATGGDMANQDYIDGRNLIKNHPLLSDKVPKFIEVCRNVDEFWTYIKGEFSSYHERREFLSETLNPLIEILEKGSLQPVSSLKNDYEELELLGQGGFGSVYKYRNKLLDYDFAVKFFDPSFPIEEERDLIRFFQEAKMLFELKHPNIIQIYDIGVSGGKPYFRMEYFPGKNLNDVLIQNGTLSPRKTLDLILNVAEAMVYAHKKVVHRDLKPSNVMVAVPNQFRIIDFGLGIYKEKQLTSRITRHSDKASDSLYTAPELHKDPKLIDKRCDIYSVGAIWYTILVGVAPSGLKIREKLLSVKDITAEYVEIVLKCLDDIDDRFKDFEELIIEVNKLISN